MSGLRLGPDLVLPVDFATEGVAVVGMRGSGKSNTEVRWVEVLHEAGVPWVAVDPKGDWWGIRSSADGKSAGLPVPVFGGLHGDFPLEERLGARIAALLVDENLSAVLDASRLSIGARARFLTEFFNRLSDRHQVEPHVRCVILEEAHRYIPQQVKGGPAAALKEAAASILLEGRAFGLGCWAATQRPARLHNDVLEEVGTLIAHRIGVAATSDLKRISDWFAHHDIAAEAKANLTKLRAGEAYVLSPEFDLVRRVQVDRRMTFDSGATPKGGGAVRRPATMADVDAAAIKEQLSDAIERAEATDPVALQRRVAELESALARALTAVPEPVEVEVPVLEEAAIDRLEAMLRDAGAGFDVALEAALGELVRVRVLQEAAHDRSKAGGISRARSAGDGARAVAPPRAEERSAAPARRDAGGATVSRAEEGPVLNRLAERKILGVLAQFPEGRTRTQLAIQAGYAAGGGGFGNAERKLRKLGLVEMADGIFTITAAGRAAAGDVKPVARAGLVDYWMGQLNRRAERVILGVLLKAWPASMTAEEVAAAGVNEAGDPYEASGGGFGNAVRKLRRLGLIEGTVSALRASDDLAGA